MCVAQLVKRLTFAFGSGHDLKNLEIKPHIGICAQWAVGLRFCLSVCLSLLPPNPCLCSLALK